MVHPEGNGAQERGQLLYEPGRSRERRFPLPWIPVMLILGGVLFCFVSLEQMDKESLWDRHGPVVISAFLFALGYATAVWVFRQMPFRVYERGVTAARVPFLDGLRRRERFVPFERVTGITIAYPWYLPDYWAIQVRYVHGGREHRFTTSFEEAPDLGPAVEALKKVSPQLVEEIPPSIEWPDRP